MAIPATLFAQTPTDVDKLITDTVAKPLPPPKKIDILQAPKKEKRFGRAVIELFVSELTPWVIDRYVTQQDYARISFQTVGHNINPTSWTWDHDPFITNQFGHPYHGSLFYSSFRTNGFTFWESVPAAFAGSYLWETFAENEPPSPNDFLNTSMGGIVLGEMTYRLSNRIINNRQRGFKRQVNEVVGLLLNPVNGLNRILDGKWGKVYGNPTDRDSSKLTAEFDLGVRQFNTTIGDLTRKGRFGWYGHAKLLYESRFQDYHTPFNNIYINTEFWNDDSSKVNLISVYGSLVGWEIKSNKELQHLAIISANYDYINNEAFFYGGQSVKLNLFSKYRQSKDLKINTELGAGPVVIAAIPNHGIYRGRNYDYTSGVGYSAGAGLSLLNKFTGAIDYRGAYLLTVNGSRTHYILHTLTGEFAYQVSDAFSIVGEPGYFFLRSYYKNETDVSRKYPYVRLSLRYKVDLYK